MAMCASLFGGRSDPVSFFAGVYVQTAKKSSVCCAESKVWGEYYNSVKNYSVMAASISVSEYFCTFVFGSNHPLVACWFAQLCIYLLYNTLATLLSRFEFEMVAGKDPELEMIFTLRSKGGVWVATKPA